MDAVVAADHGSGVDVHQVARPRLDVVTQEALEAGLLVAPLPDEAAFIGAVASIDSFPHARSRLFTVILSMLRFSRFAKINPQMFPISMQW